jgi:membrane-bound lytic murein transglycosylase MltF
MRFVSFFAQFFYLCFFAMCIFASPSLAADKSEEIIETYFSLPILQNWTGDFDQILKRRTLRVLVPFSKTFFFIDKGNEYGISAELGRELEKWINKKHEFGLLSFHVIFIPKPQDQLIPALLAGEGDLIDFCLTSTAERREKVDFTTSWIKDGKAILVAGLNAPAIAKLEDLSGKEIFVRKSSSYRSDLDRINQEFLNKNINPIKIRFVDENIEDEDILEAVNVGMLSYAVVHRRIADTWSRIFTAIRVRNDIVFNANEQVAWAIRKNSPLLMKEINEFIEAHGIGTSYGNEILRRYFSESKTIKNSLSEGEIEKFTQMVDIFKKYGNKYSFDYLMVAAQGYQESQLNQNKKSPRGAVGVMQLLPATAAAKPIEVTGVDKDPDANIKAGTLYLRYLRDSYVNDPAVNDINQMLMTLAAYNAGPGNLKAFRQIARDQGLNPNIWFNNVEYGAARKVGRETVQYVSNIYKYYLAYKLITEREAEQKAARESGISKK